MGASDGWTDLKTDHRMDWSYDAPQPGNVVQLARTALDGQRAQHLARAPVREQGVGGAGGIEPGVSHGAQARTGPRWRLPTR